MYNKRLLLLASATLCFILLWRNEHRLYDVDWRETIFREDQTAKVSAQLRKLPFNVTNNVDVSQKLNVVTATTASNIMMNHSAHDYRRRYNTTKRRCNRYLDPSYCGQVQRNRTDCSCEIDLGAYHCCQRAVLRVHKMGIMAVQSWKDEYFGPILRRDLPIPEITSHRTLGSQFRMMKDKPIRDGDYRHVVVTRNWYDALISGYLYHKSGKECWLNYFGRPSYRGWLLENKQEDWEQRLLNPSIDTNMSFYRSVINMTWNPGNGRNLCRYLIDEPEEMGLRVYIAWSMDLYMYPLLDFQTRRQEQELQNGRNRTKYVCYEQFTNPNTQSDVYHDMSQWLLPDRNLTFNRLKTTSAATEKRRTDHASDTDPKLRERMHAMMRKLDTDVFGGAIASSNAQFGCGPK
jgi:hypothetical protein